MAKGVSAGSDISSEWSDQRAGVVSGGRPEGGCPLRISGVLIIRSNSAVRATGVELQEIPQLIIIVKYGYNLPPEDSSEN